MCPFQSLRVPEIRVSDLAQIGAFSSVFLAPHWLQLRWLATSRTGMRRGSLSDDGGMNRCRWQMSQPTSSMVPFLERSASVTALVLSGRRLVSAPTSTLLNQLHQLRQVSDQFGDLARLINGQL